MESDDIFAICIFMILMLLAIEEPTGGFQNIFYIVLVFISMAGFVYFLAKNEPA